MQFSPPAGRENSTNLQLFPAAGGKEIKKTLIIEKQLISVFFLTIDLNSLLNRKQTEANSYLIYSAPFPLDRRLRRPFFS